MHLMTHDFHLISRKKNIFQIPGSIWVVKPCLHPLPFPFPVLWLPPDQKDWHLFHLEVNMIIYECFEKLKENPIGLQTKFRQFRRRSYLWKIRQEDRKCGIFIISYISTFSLNNIYVLNCIHSIFFFVKRKIWLV